MDDYAEKNPTYVGSDTPERLQASYFSELHFKNVKGSIQEHSLCGGRQKRHPRCFRHCQGFQVRDLSDSDIAYIAEAIEHLRSSGAIK